MTTTQDNEKVVGHMEFVDNMKYMWCSFTKKIIAPFPVDIIKYLVLVNNNITLYNSRCEWDGHCFNYGCKYNQDKNATVHKHYAKGTSVEKYLSDDNILKIRRNLEEMSKHVVSKNI